MNSARTVGVVCLALLWGPGLLFRAAAAAEGEPGPAAYRVPPGTLPSIGAWFWKEREFEPEGYRPILDAMAEHSPYDLLTVSMRVKRELTDEEVYQQLRKAVGYARQRGMRMAMNLDVRLARSGFLKRFPDEQQEVIRLAEAALADTGTVAVSAAPLKLGDHMTGGTTPYSSLGGHVARVYRYMKGPEGIEPETVRDITRECRVLKAGPEGVQVEVPCGPDTKGAHACVLVAFTHFTPDVFAPHLLPYLEELVRKYGDIGLAGATLDEWGFPPSYGSLAGNDLWYSRGYEAAYAERTGGHELLRDCLLMYGEERGRHGERVAAINRYLELNRLRNGEIEDRFYQIVKQVFGLGSFVGVHATWWPDVCPREFKKNGLDWWIATRDLAQTDESTPWCVRTSLCKKSGSSVCYNQYYNPALAPYLQEVWSDVLAGGRVNYHPRYPLPPGVKDRDFGHTDLMRGALMRAECRVRMLNFIAKSPADCPVAVLFGHACAMNWAGPAHGEAGVQLAGKLRAAGVPADLIPSSEIGGKTLRGDEEGFLRYGPQRYAAMVLYHPEFEGAQTAELLHRTAAGEKTALHRLGSWTTDFDGRPFDGGAAMPPTMTAATDEVACVQQVVAQMKRRGIEPQDCPGPLKRGVEIIAQGPESPRYGSSRLIDGTRILVAAQRDPAGDPIKTTIKIGGEEVELDAVGVAAVRLTANGRLDAFAAGGLRRLRVRDTTIDLPARADVALWCGADDRWHGVLQDFVGEVPLVLTAFTKDWLRLAVPPPLADAGPSK